MKFRTGIGYDVHRLVEGRPLILGGVEIPFDRGLEGHSDADVLCHAIADALLGAGGFKDIGHFFPNTDPTIAGISSLHILSRIRQLLEETHWEISNVDATLVAEAPKIAPYLEAMIDAMSNSLGISRDQISIKATTNEGLGFPGRGEGIAALATAALISDTASR